jgi:isoleucyl-tRNA synthetase
VASSGIEAWFSLDAAELLGTDAAQYEKVDDVMDVWLDSGLSHRAVGRLRDEVDIPADLYLEGSDQHRGWFQSSLLTSVALDGEAPYKGVLTHGFTVDERGRKMSKSLGNVVAPQTIYKTLGADILRLWVAATDYRAEMNVSNEILKRVADAYRRLRNTQRFLLGNLHGFDPATDTVSSEDMLALDAWAVDQARMLQDEVIGAYDRFEFHHIYQKVHNFCVIDLGGFYLDVIKDRLYTTRTASLARRSAQTAMQHIAEAMVRWLAPILSFTADEIWQALPGKRSESAFLSTWYEFPPKQRPAPLEWDTVIAVRQAVSKELERLRAADTIGSPLDAVATIYCDQPLKTHLQALATELRFVFITSDADVREATARPETAIAADWNDQPFWIQVARSESPKCVRCWHRRADVGSDAGHPELCARCVSNVGGPGEERRFA